MARQKKTSTVGSVVTVHSGDHVYLQKKLLSNGQWSLRLNLHRPGMPRSVQSLDMRLVGNRTADAETLTAARAALTTMEHTLRAERRGDVNPALTKVALVDFFESVARTKNTPGEYLSTLKVLRGFLGGRPFFVTDVSRRWAEQFKAHLLTLGYASNTAHNYWRKFVTVMRVAVRERIIASNPLTDIDAPRKVRAMRRSLTTEELAVLARTPYGRNDVRRAFLFSCYTGLRWSDVSTLTWGAIRDNAVRIRMRKTKGIVLVPLGRTALDLLGERGAEDDLVFSLPGYTAVCAGMHRWAKRAGLEPFTFHTSRHTFAMELLRNGVDIFTVSKLLGHASVKETEVYLHDDPRMRTAAISMLPDLDITF